MGPADHGLIGRALTELLRASTVALEVHTRAETVLGTGFFVAPGIVATCAHVLAKQRDRLPEIVAGRIVASEAGAADRELVLEPVAEWFTADGDTGPDLAFLRVPTALDVASVPLSDVVEVGDALWTFGHPAAARGGQSALFTALGPTRIRGQAGDWDPERVQGTPVGGGYSGSPVLNSRTGAVAGLLYSSDLGGSAHVVPAADILTALRVTVGAVPDPPAPARWLALLDDEQIRAGGWRYPGPRLRDYLQVAALAAADHPFRSLLPHVGAPSLTAVYQSQSVRTVGPGGDDGGSARQDTDLEPWGTILDDYADCVVVAGPGAGKSSLLRHTVLDLARRWQDIARADPPDPSDPSRSERSQDEGETMRAADGGVPRFVPVRVSAADLAEADSLSTGIAASVNAEHRGYGQIEPQPAALFATEPVPGARWLVLVDGLDEVFDPLARKQVVRGIRAAAARGERATPYRFVLATRPLPGGELSGGVPALDTRYVELLPFGRSDLLAFAEAWFRALGRPKDPQLEALDFDEAVAKSPLASLAHTPLIATILCQLFSVRPDIPLPGSLSETYAGFTGLLRDRWMRERLPGEKNADEVAAAALSRDGGSAAVAVGAQVLDTTDELLARLAVVRLEGRTTPAVELFAQWTQQPARVSAEAWTEFLHDVLRRSGVMVQRAGDFTFLHYTITEYLAATYTAADRQRSDAAFATVLGRWERRWPYSGFWSRRRVQRVVGACIPERARFWLPSSWHGPVYPDASYYGFLITAWRDRPDLTPTLLHIIARTRTDGTRFTVALLKQDAALDPAVVDATGKALAREALKPSPVEGPRYYALSGRNEIDGHHRYRCAVSLWQIGDPRTIEVFAALAADPTLHSRFRRHAAEQLADFGDERGRDLLAALATAKPTTDRLTWRDVQLRWQAAATAAGHGDQRGADELAALSADNTMRTLRWASAAILLGVGDPRAGDLLFDLTGDESVSAGERMHVAAFLAAHGDARGADRFAALAVDGRLSNDDFWRATVMTRLVGDPRLAAVLNALAVRHGREVFQADEFPEAVRRRADQALVDLLGDDAVAMFLAMSSNQEYCQDFPWEIAEALARPGNRFWSNVLIGLVTDPELAREHRMRAAAVFALVLDEAQARSMYLALEQDCTLDREGRFGACLALIGLGVSRDAKWRDPCPKQKSQAVTTTPAEPDPAASAEVLGRTFQAELRPSRQVQHAENILAGATRLFGAADRETLGARNQSAVFRAAEAGAEAMIPPFEDLLADAVRELGDDDRLTLRILGNLAWARYTAGDLAAALALYERTLTGAEKTLGDLDTETLTARYDLAQALADSGDTARAGALFELAYAGRLRVHGADHRDTLAARYQAARTRHRAGALDEAVALYEQILAAQQSALGGDDADTLLTAGTLAVAHHQAGRLAEAIALHESTLAQHRRILGETDPRTLASAHDLAECHAADGAPTTALPLYRQAYDGRRGLLGLEDPDTLASLRGLVSAYEAAGRPETVEPPDLEALEALRHADAAQHRAVEPRTSPERSPVDGRSGP
ncbi:tetratricopeptide repeat protein [Streptomyces sp. NBC_00433]